MFISFLHMFRATMCPSSGETTWYLLFRMDDSAIQSGMNLVSHK